MKFVIKLVFFIGIGYFLVLTGVRAYLNVAVTAYSEANEERAYPYEIVVFESDGRVSGDISGISEMASEREVASDLGAVAYPEDRVGAFPEIKMRMGAKITIHRAPMYQIIDGKKDYWVRSWAGTVAGLLEEKKIEIGTDDKINFATDFELDDKMTIKIIRVAKTTVVEKEKINYQTVKRDDSTLDKGKTRVEKKGVLGERELTYLVTREDGAEVSRVLTGNQITKEAEDEILIIGTKPVITTRCKYDDWVLEAAVKNGVDPNGMCYRMMKESNGNANSDGGGYKGLFQYEEGLWNSVSAKAGFAGASIWDARSQIFVTAWAWSHGYRSRWPNP